MNLISKGSWIFLFVVLIASIGIIDYAKNDSFFGLYSFEKGEFNESLQSNYKTEVYFCPEDACATNLINQINSAKESIDVAIYSFTNDEISDALIEAHKRGIKVRVIFDYFQSVNEYSDDEKLIDAGINILRKKGSGVMHNKFMIIDNEKVLTGSFNYSMNANEKNDENLILIEEERIALKYTAEFEEILNQARNKETNSE